MSVSELFSYNTFDLQCKDITVVDTATIGNLITSGQKRNVIRVSSSTILTSSESGSLIMISPSLTANITITMPSPADGLYYDFYVDSLPNDTYTTTISGLMAGQYTSGTTGLSSTTFNTASNLILSATAANANVGSYASFIGTSSSGGFWLVNALSSHGWSTS